MQLSSNAKCPPISRIQVFLLVLASGYALGFLSLAAVSQHKQQVQVVIRNVWKNESSALKNSSTAKNQPSPAIACPREPTAGQSPTAATVAVANRDSLQQPRQPAHMTNAPVNRTDSVASTQQAIQGLISHAELDHVGTEGAAVCDKGVSMGLKLNVTADIVAPIVVMGHNRVGYLARCILVLLKYWSEDPANASRFPLFVSIDGGDQRSLNMAAALREATGLQVISRLRTPAVCNDGDCNLTAHFKMLLQLFFQCLQSPRLIFLEEDLEVSPDFLSYFAATAPLLAQDPSLWCVSAWNDHGVIGRAVNHTALYRTDIIPGLGWMLTKEQALPLIDKWPKIYWDDWMRDPNIRLDRQCVFPEVSRTHHFGRVGTHFGGIPNDPFYYKYLAKMLLNSQPVDWNKQNLTYLLKDNYKDLMDSWLSKSTPYNESMLGDLHEYCNSSKPAENIDLDLVLTYRWSVSDHNGFIEVANKLSGMMNDIRGQRPRASYKGIVMVRCRGRRLFLKPSS